MVRFRFALARLRLAQIAVQEFHRRDARASDEKLVICRRLSLIVQPSDVFKSSIGTLRVNTRE